MMRVARVTVLLALAAVPATAQTAGRASPDLERGERAYRALEYDSAAALLRRGLAAAGLPDSLRRRGLVYLGATELFRGRRDSAVAAFAEVVRTDPAYAPDSLVFPPRVTSLFQEVRRTASVAVTPPPVAARIPPPPAVTSTPTRPDSVLVRPTPPERASEQVAPVILPQSARVSLSAGTGLAWLKSAGAASHGAVLHGAAEMAIGVVSLRVALAEGRLDGDMVEGSADLGVRPVHWLAFRVGPGARAYVTDSATARLVAWRVGAHVDGPELEGRMYSSLEVWRSLQMGGNVPGAGAGAWQGGEADLTFRVGGPVLLRIDYRIDDVVTGAGKQTLTGFSAGLALPVR